MTRTVDMGASKVDCEASAFVRGQYCRRLTRAASAFSRAVTLLERGGVIMRRDRHASPSLLRKARRRADTMGMPVRANPYYTVDEVLAFPDDGNKYELIYGELVVSPSPRFWHQEVVMRLTRLLLDYCRREPVGRVFNVDADLTWGRNDVLTQPDVFVLAPQDCDVARWEDVRNVPLAEVLSISTARHDRFGKRVVYRDQRVYTYGSLMWTRTRWRCGHRTRSFRVWSVSDWCGRRLAQGKAKCGDAGSSDCE